MICFHRRVMRIRLSSNQAISISFWYCLDFSEEVVENTNFFVIRELQILYSTLNKKENTVFPVHYARHFWSYFNISFMFSTIPHSYIPNFCFLKTFKNLTLWQWFLKLELPFKNLLSFIFILRVLWANQTTKLYPFPSYFLIGNFAYIFADRLNSSNSNITMLKETKNIE